LGSGSPPHGAAARFGFVLALALVPRAAALAADPVLIRGARVLTVSGAPLEVGDVLVEAGKIKAVGARLEASGASVVDAAGKTLIPGLVDARSCLFVPEVERRDRGGQADWNVLDALDADEGDAMRALSGGVTTVYVGPDSGSAIAGRGAVLKPKPGVAIADCLLRSDAALELTIGGDGATSSMGRLNAYLSLRRAFADAKEYRKAWTKYREDLAEYEKKKKERDEARKKREDASGKKPEGDASKAPGADAGGAGKPAAGAEKKTDPPPDAKKDSPPEAKKDDAKKDDGKKDDKPAEPKLERPKKPAPDPAKDVLVRAIEGKIPVRIAAQRADEILNALRLAEEFDLRLVLDGVGEGGRVAPELSRRNIPVIVGPILRGSSPSVADLWYDPLGPLALADATVPVVVSSGATTPRATASLAVQASLLVGRGLDRAKALRSITLGAAEALGVADRVGSIEPGKDADLVLLDGDPIDTRSRVESVWVDGELLYTRE
jgi:imidazolonepropionase-like amidohydrolase